MFNVICYTAEILVSLVCAIRADVNQMSKVSQQYPLLGIQQDSTFLNILAVPNNADFCSYSILISILSLSIYF